MRLIGRREGSPPYEDVAQALHVSRAEFDAAVAEKKDLANPVTGFRKILGVTRVIGKVALELYDRGAPELLMVYFQGTDEIGHVLGRYAAPKLPAVSEEDFRKYKDGVAALYVEADRILGELARRARKDGATLILASDHGFRHGDRPPGPLVRHELRHRVPVARAARHPRRGGSGRDARPACAGEASVFDVTPTLCRILGLPAGPGLRGEADRRLLASAGRAGGLLGEDRSRRAARRRGATPERRRGKSADEFTKKLISLGYLTGAEASAVDARPADRAGTETAGLVPERRDVPARPRKAGRGGGVVSQGPRGEPEVRDRVDQPLDGAPPDRQVTTSRTTRSSRRSRTATSIPREPSTAA